MYRVMYRLGWDGQNKVLSSELGAPKLLQGKITKAVGSYDIFSCTIDPTQEAFSAITPLTTFITVIRTKPPLRILFEGRVLTVQPAMGSDGTINNVVTAEGLESFLHDSVQPWAEFHNTSPKDFLLSVLNQHNAQVEPYKQVKLGVITMTNSTDNVYRFSDDTKDSYNNIKEKLIDRLGGEIRVRHESNGLFLDYMPIIGVKSDQPIQLRRNLLSMSQKLDPSDVITVLKPLGAAEERTTAEGETQAVSTPRLTISGVNGGSPFLRDQKLIDQFGIQVGVQTWDDVKTDSILLTKGKEFLTNQKPVKQLVQITAVDLSLVGRSPSDFWCGNYYDIINPFIGFAQTLRLSAQVIDIVDPKSSTLQAGDVVLSQEQYNLNLRQQVQQAQQFTQSYESRLRSQAIQIANLKLTTKDLGQEVATLKDLINGDYSAGDMTNAGYRISQANLKLIKKYARANNLKPSFLVAQMFVESHWGDPKTSAVGEVDNNWSGISQPFSVPADLGVQMSQGTARPEGGYYVHFKTLDDYFKAYAYVLSARNGIYVVSGKTTIDEFCKGLFKVGGAAYDYAAAGYEAYRKLLIPTYEAIVKENDTKITQLDK